MVVRSSPMARMYASWSLSSFSQELRHLRAGRRIQAGAGAPAGLDVDPGQLRVCLRVRAGLGRAGQLVHGRIRGQRDAKRAERLSALTGRHAHRLVRGGVAEQLLRDQGVIHVRDRGLDGDEPGRRRGMAGIGPGPGVRLDARPRLLDLGLAGRRDALRGERPLDAAAGRRRRPDRRRTRRPARDHRAGGAHGDGGQSASLSRGPGRAGGRMQSCLHGRVIPCLGSLAPRRSARDVRNAWISTRADAGDSERASLRRESQTPQPGESKRHAFGSLPDEHARLAGRCCICIPDAFRIAQKEDSFHDQADHCG